MNKTSEALIEAVQHLFDMRKGKCSTRVMKNAWNIVAIALSDFKKAYASQSRTMTEDEIKAEAEKYAEGLYNAQEIFSWDAEMIAKAVIFGAHLTNAFIQPKGMRWVNLNDKFPDDWESKIIREVANKRLLDNNLYEHRYDRIMSLSSPSINYKYNQLEWLDENYNI